MTEQTVIKTYFDANGAPTARIVATHDNYEVGERAGTYCHTNAHTVIISAGYNVDESYYTDTQEPLKDGPIMAAWNRYSRDEYGNELNSRDAAELTQRYARTYWPMVPIVQRRLITGYSQGDEVTVLSWVEPANANPAPNEAPYETATRNRAGIKGHHDIMEAVSRGQFWTVELQTPEFDWTPDSDHGDVWHVETEWTTDNDDDHGPTYTLAMEEFRPWDELTTYAEWALNIPNHHTTNTDTYEL